MTNKREGRDRAAQKQKRSKIPVTTIQRQRLLYPELKGHHTSVRQNVKNLHDEIMNHLLVLIFDY